MIFVNEKSGTNSLYGFCFTINYVAFSLSIDLSGNGKDDVSVGKRKKHEDVKVEE